MVVIDSLNEHNLKASFFELLSNFEVLNPKITPILFIFLFVVQLLSMSSGSYRFTKGINPNHGLFEKVPNPKSLSFT
jgi:hypothetical protein